MSVSEPGKIITPWAESGLKNPIPPTANPATGRAGFDQGFSAINMTAKEAGGIPPFGQDFNGIFYEVTNILRYMQAGGQPTFDASLATAIGGYPKGAMVLGSDGVTLWQSKIDSNSTDPNADPSAWGVVDVGLRSFFSGPDDSGLDDFFGGGGWTGPEVAGANIYNNGTITYTNALRQRYSVPITPDPLPIQWFEKTTSATRADSVQRWDQGCSYHSLTKNGGSAFGATDTSVAKNLSGDGQLIAKHMRGESRHADAETWGGWSYGAVLGDAIPAGAKGTVAHEFNLNNQGPDMGWMQTADVGAIRGLICVTQDNSNPVTQMIVVGRGSAAPDGFIWTGALFRADSFVVPTEPLTSVGNGEAIRLEGSMLSLASNGIRFRGGTFRTGISLAESAFSNNCAILLADNHRITVGAGPANTTYLAFNRAENWANFQNMVLRLNGIKVLGERQTGMFQLTGTADGTTKNTETMTLVELARYVKKVTDALITHGMIGPT